MIVVLGLLWCNIVLSNHTTILKLPKDVVSGNKYHKNIRADGTFKKYGMQVVDKIAALKLHQSQIKSHNDENTWIYGIKGRAQYRGYQINCKFAEAFEIVKEINNFD